MAKQEIQPIEDEKEKKAIEWENNVLFILVPSVGLIAFLFGLIGAIFALSSTDPAFKDSKVGTAVFLIILAVLGAGGIVYGVLQFFKRRKLKRMKQEKQPE